MNLTIQSEVPVALDPQESERLILFKIPKRIIYAIEAVLDIALNSGLEPVRNESIAKRQGIPKRYLEQTLQTLVKKRILVASRGPRGGYRLAKERRKIKISDIILSIVEAKDKESNFKSQLSNNIVKPLLNELNETCYKKLKQVTVEDIYTQIKKSTNKNKNENLDFVI